MLNRARALEILRQQRSRLESRGISHAGVFGSLARDEAQASSDIDIVVTPASGRRLDLIELGAVQSLLEDAFAGFDVDLLVDPIRRPDLLAAVSRDRANAF
ncbi:MAG: nucleotidyltransferase domain-containing protein [Woeseia sp.]